MPRDRTLISQIDQTARNLESVNNYITVGMEIAMEVANDCIEHVKESSRDTVMASMRDTMLRYAKMERDIRQFEAAMEQVKVKLENSDEGANIDLVKTLDDELAKIQAANGNSTAELYQHEKYLELDQRIKEGESQASSSEEPCSAEVEREGELLVMQRDVVVTCPYTGVLMKKPVRNKICNHNYDADGIKAYIGARGKRARCPVVGCGNQKPIELEDLEENHDLRRHIEQLNRQPRKAAS